MVCIILKIRVKLTLENNVEIQTKQVVKQFDNKEKFSLSTTGSSQKRNPDFILYQKELNGAIFVNDNGGKLKVHYDLIQDEEKMGSYQYEITYKEMP